MYKFKPIIKNLIWGKESWVLSGVKGFESVVAEGPKAGKSICDIWQGEFPLLIKFIDAHQDLSIQVHPNDELAAKRHGCNGKTEMWYVIGATPEAHLYSGLKKRITPDEYESRVADGSITEVLANYKVTPGEVFFLPAGRIHAISGGCYIAEIQQTSDITYRIYDYGRLGLDGKPRQLHVAEAKEAIDYSVEADYRMTYTAEADRESLLVDCEYFTTSLLDLTKPFSRNIDTDFLIVICMEGSATVNGSGLRAGESGLILDEKELAAVPSATGAKLLTVSSRVRAQK